jgi:hypothetical protein
MFLNNLIKGKATTAPAEVVEQQAPRKGKRLSEEDPKSLMKRVALGDVTNKQEKHKATTTVSRLTRVCVKIKYINNNWLTYFLQSKKKELDQQSLFCAESAIKLAQPNPSPGRFFF